MIEPYVPGTGLASCSGVSGPQLSMRVRVAHT